MQCTVCSVQCALSSVQCAVYNVQCAMRDLTEVSVEISPVGFLQSGAQPKVCNQTVLSTARTGAGTYSCYTGHSKRDLYSDERNENNLVF